MVTILPVLRQVCEDLVSLLDRTAVERACHALGHRWRPRRLDPFTTLHVFILQVLHQNTAMTHLPHLTGEHFSPSAYCQARQRLPVELFQRVVNSFTQRLPRSDQAGRWHGHRVVLVDGSAFSMPDTPELRAHFGQPGGQQPGCGFPVAHLLAMVDAETGFLYDVIVSPLRTHDMALVAKLHPKMSAGDVIVADRGFCSYAHLALVSQAGLHGVFRMHQRQIVDFHPHRRCAAAASAKGRPGSRWIRHLGHCDQLVEWPKPRARPKWMTQEQFDSLPETLLLREIKWSVRKAGCRVREVTLVTTLLDAERYPAKDIAHLYQVRWQVEVDLRDLKITLGLDVLKAHKVATVTKEVLVHVLVYNLIRLVMLQTARQQRVKPHRISFIDALRWLQPAKPTQPLLSLIVNPVRPGRIEPRCLKRRPKEYDRMTRPRPELRKLLKEQPYAA
jgi:hypothetical protein